jgi:alcohol dehydrogenase class IV
MQIFNYPTTIYYGEGALQAAIKAIALTGHKKVLFVTDSVLSKIGMAAKVLQYFSEANVETLLFDQVHSNPIEADVWAGAELYRTNNCDGIFSLGGGSPNDTAKVIAIAATHEGPLERFEDCKGGDANVVNPLPPIYSAATTAGTGSEVGRSGLVTLESTGLKTIIFHPDLLPKIAILEPSLTTDLPTMVTATTGVDALSHNLEAYLAKGFHPMADGIALQGIELALENLPKVLATPDNIEGRARMLLASAMGSTAFQKGLGAAHAMANALTAHNNLHHGTGIALTLPATIEFLEAATLDATQQKRLSIVKDLFETALQHKAPLSVLLHKFIANTGISMNLKNHGFTSEMIPNLSKIAFEDPSHGGNMIPVKREHFEGIFKSAMRDWDN